MVFIVMLLMYGVCCYYIGLRFFQWLKLLMPAFSPLVFWLAWGLLAAGMIAALMQRQGWLAYMGGIWIAIFVYSLMINVAIDLFRQLSRLWHGGKPVFANPTVWTGALTVVLVALIIIGGMVNAATVRTKRYDVPLAGLPQAADGMKVVVVSDIHLGAINGVKHVQKIVDAVNAADADVVLLAGDIFDGDFAKAREIEQVEQLFTTIQSKYGVYAVFGNHDTNDPAGQSAAFLERAGVVLLYNQAAVLPNGIVLVGRADYAPIGDGDRIPLADIAYDRDATVIVIDHQPQAAAADEAAANGAELMVSGHTHRGQLFPANLLTSRMYPTHYGLTEHDGMTLAVTSGAGTWGPPLRVGTESEIMVLTLTRA